ncbi:MAG: hypothetical protein S0880_10295, partial [Actinomycetota bacterium]|nr:hypothetical protein [Actinomycetota bacterium]
MAEDVSIVVATVDRTARGLRSIEARLNGFSQRVNRQFGSGFMGGSGQNAPEQKVRRFGDAMGGAMNVAKGFLAANVIGGLTDQVMRFGQESFEQATALRESFNAVEQVFEDQAATIKHFGDVSATQYGLSQRAFQQMATPLGAMLKNLGLDMTDVADQTIVLTKRAADMASVFDTDVDQALGAIQAALRGEIDPIERYGVKINAAAVEQRALADSGKAAKSELTELDKGLARLDLILEQTNDTAGDFRRTSDDVANSARITAAEIEEEQAAIGEALIPAMRRAGNIKLQLARAAGSLAQALGPVIDKTGQYLDKVNEMQRASDEARNKDGFWAVLGLEDGLTWDPGEFWDRLLHGSDAFHGRIEDAKPSLADATDRMDELRRARTRDVEASHEQADAQVEVTEKIDEHAAALEDLVDAIDEAAGRQKDYADSVLSVRDAELRLNEVLHDSEATTEDVRDAFIDLAQERADSRQAAEEATGAVWDERDANMALAQELLTLAENAQGPAREAILGYVEDLAGIPEERSTEFRAAVNDGDLAEVDREMRMATRAREIQVHIRQFGWDPRLPDHLANDRRTGGITGSAAGGGPRGRRTLVGEDGPEIVDLAPGSQVHSTPDTMRMLS